MPSEKLNDYFFMNAALQNEKIASKYFAFDIYN
jgi:hypothetical protein